VQVLDEESGLPKTEDGRWLVGPNAKAVSTPIGVLMEESADGLVTKSGVRVEYRRGVLVHLGTRRPHLPDDDSRREGPYQSKSAKLTLGGYLTEPVLTDDRTNRMDTTATAMFVMLEAYPLSMLTALIGTLSVVLFLLRRCLALSQG